MLYFAAFIPGLKDLAADIVCRRLGNDSIRSLMDGAVIFETAVTYDKFNFFCFNNIFIIIDVLEQKDREQTGQELLEIHLRKNPGRDKTDLISHNSQKIKSFRLVFSAENKPVSVDENAKRRMEKYIAGVSQLEVNRSSPDTEFWFLYRREGFSFFMKRLTNHRTGEKSLHPGELNPQLAWVLCCIAELKHGETMADPFCGYGSIPLAAARHFPVKKIYSFDADAQCVKITASRKGLKENKICEIRTSRFDTLPRNIPEKADAIVTDPPWGMYESGISLDSFYHDMINVFAASLKDNGRAVILSAAVKELESAVEKSKLLAISLKIPILVSGKKAVIFKLEKSAVLLSS